MRLFSKAVVQRAPTELPRRLVWREASHRLLGLFGLDPAGNVICRFREGRNGVLGWTRAQRLDAARTFPLHWQAAATLVNDSVSRAVSDAARNAAQPMAAAATEAAEAPRRGADDAEKGSSTSDEGAAAPTTASEGQPQTQGKTGLYPRFASLYERNTGTLRIGEVLSAGANVRRLRVSSWATLSYKVIFYGTWLGCGVGAICGYLRLKTRFLGHQTRMKLNAIEDAAVASARYFGVPTTEDEFYAWADRQGLPADAAESLLAWLAGVREAFVVLAESAGYDAQTHQRDLDRAAFDAAQVRRSVEKRQRAVSNWTATGWASILLMLISLIFM